MPAPARPIRLHGYELSGHVHRVRLFLTLLDLAFDAVEVDLRRGDQRQPAFLALNPFGQVPVIDDDGSVVADSNAILTYLALRYADASWLPRDPVGAARVQRWLSAAAGPLAAGAAAARVIKLFGLPDDPQPAQDRARRLLGAQEHLLAEGAMPFLAATQPTIADLAMYTYTAHAPEGGISLEPYPAVRAWLRRVEALPRFVPMAASRIGLAA